MSKLKYGTVITDQRGSIAGVTFSSGRFGQVARVRTIPRLQMTAATSKIRNSLGQFSQRWSAALNQTQRDNWKILADANPVTDVFGSQRKLTGHQFYVRVNQLRFLAGLTVLDNAPGDQLVTALTSCTVTVTSAPSLSIAFGASPLAAANRLYLFAGPSLSPGKLATDATLKFIGVSPAAQATPFNALAQYQAVWHNPVQGRAITFLTATLKEANGAVSVGLRSIVVVT